MPEPTPLMADAAVTVRDMHTKMVAQYSWMTWEQTVIHSILWHCQFLLEIWVQFWVPIVLGSGLTLHRPPLPWEWTPSASIQQLLNACFELCVFKCHFIQIVMNSFGIICLLYIYRVILKFPNSSREYNIIVGLPKVSFSQAPTFAAYLKIYPWTKGQKT